MNKLEEYRDIKKQEIGEEVSEPDIQTQRAYCYEEGFDAAIGLELPVKFMEWREGWQAKESIKIEDKHIKTQTLHTEEYYNELAPILFPNKKELYQYWIDNIYKPE